MSVKSEQQRSCLCGAVYIFVKTNSKSVAAYHCNMCRKWTGGPLLAIECSNQIRFEGSNNISVFNSSEWDERGFCSKCRSHVFYRLKQEGDYIIPVGLLDNDSNFTFEQQIFIDQKPSFYSFANQTKNMTEVEVFAQYSEFSDRE